MSKKRAYIKFPIWWIDDRRIASKSDAEWRKFVEDYFNDPKNIHYEIFRPPMRREFEKIKPYIRDELFAKFNYQCAYCGSNKKLEIDHIIPIARGGNNKRSNLQVLCRKCNRKKGAR